MMTNLEDTKEMPKVSRKPRAKKETTSIVQDIEEVAASVEAEVDKYEEILKEKTMTELIRLHDEAILAEDAAKRELHILRQRAANMATIADDTVEKAVSTAKAKVAEAIAWLHAIEKRLFGVPRDIWGEKYGRTVEQFKAEHPVHRPI